jgi:hypothetical protein
MVFVGAAVGTRLCSVRIGKLASVCAFSQQQGMHVIFLGTRDNNMSTLLGGFVVLTNQHQQLNIFECN